MMSLYGGSLSVCKELLENNSRKREGGLAKEKLETKQSYDTHYIHKTKKIHFALQTDLFDREHLIEISWPDRLQDKRNDRYK